MRKTTIFVLLAAGATLPLFAQSSPSYRLDEHAFNAGGRPANGSLPVSPNLLISLDAIGDAAVHPVLAGAGYRLEGGFAGAYPPPGEAVGLRFPDPDTLEWNPERSAGIYNLYREEFSTLPGLAYGSCLQSAVVGETLDDDELPGAGEGFFYLVTAKNRLGEEGTKGRDSAGAWRPNPSACP